MTRSRLIDILTPLAGTMPREIISCTVWLGASLSVAASLYMVTKRKREKHHGPPGSRIPWCVSAVRT